MLANNVSHIVIGIGSQTAGAKGQAVVFVIYHAQETIDIFFVDEKTRQTKNIPGRIVHMDSHLDIAFPAGGHDGFQEVLQVSPELLVVYAFVCLE